MVPTTELFDLIKRLTKSEKRYFTVNSKAQKGSKLYLTLFQEMDKMETYDEAKLKDRLKSLGFKPTNLAVTKVHLTKLILKALRSFYEGNTREHTVLSMLLEAEILKNKGLYQQAIKHFEKAKDTARHFEMHYHIFEILNRLIFTHIGLFVKGTPEKLEALFEEMESLKNLAYKEAEVKTLACKAWLIPNTKQLRRPATLSAIEAIECHPMLQEIETGDTFFTKIYYFSAHAHLNHAKGEYQKANQHYKKILELWNSHPHIRDINNRTYKSDITNYLNSCHTLGKYEVFDEWLERFESIKDTNFNEEAGSFKDYYHLTLLYLLNTAQLKRALEIVPKVEYGLKAYKPRINKAREISLRFNVFFVFFCNERFSEALDWLNTLDLDKKLEAKADTKALARIIRVIVHYELGHTRILEDLRTSVYRKLKKENQLHEFERTILEHIRHLENTPDKKDKKVLFESLLEKLNAIGETYGMQKIAGLEDIVCWAESRVYNKSYLEVLEQRKKP